MRNLSILHQLGLFMYIIKYIFEIIVDLVLFLCAGDDMIKIIKWIKNRK